MSIKKRDENFSHFSTLILLGIDTPIFLSVLVIEKILKKVYLLNFLSKERC